MDEINGSSALESEWVTLGELLRSIEQSPEVEERLSQWESKWQTACKKLFTDRGITDIDIPPLPKERLRSSIISDLFKERCRSMGIYDLVEAMVNDVICLIKYFLTLPEAQPILKFIQKEKQRYIDEANKSSAPIRSFLLRTGIQGLDSEQMVELLPPLKKVVFKPVEPPFEPLMMGWEFVDNFFNTFLREVAEEFITQREKLLRESDEGRAFTFSRSGKGFERAIGKHIDQEIALARSAKDPIDLLIYSLIKRGGYRSKEVKEELYLVGESLTDDAIRQRLSRLQRRIENEPEADGEQ